MAVDPLTLTVATVLATKALESVGGEAGRSAWSAMGRLVGVVRRRFARDPRATAVLERAQEAPDDTVSLQHLAEALQDHIAQDPIFHSELAAWIEEVRRHPALGGFVTQVAGQPRVGAIITAQAVQIGAPQLLTALPRTPAQLPPDVAEFTGRQAELAGLHELVSERGTGGETVVISAIAGTAGVGKTALAVHLAHELAPRFPDAQLYVNLHGYDARQRLCPAQVLDRFLRALGTPDEALPVDVDEQASLYRSLLAGKHALVVLDNASSADQVRPLLPGSPTCLVLVTSRDMLSGLVAQDGARLLNLDVLDPEEAVELLARITGNDRVDREPQAAIEVACLCGHLPLAVRIAAARLAARPGWTLADLAERLADEQYRLHELKTGDVEVRASFALSYKGLDLLTARMFRRLGLVAGPHFTVGVAATSIDTTLEDAEALLEALVDAHLLEPAATPGRYRFHDLLRLYARECVHAEESDQERAAAVRRMLNWYLEGAEAADRVLTPARRRLQRDSPGNSDRAMAPAQALAWFEAERTSLVAATRQAADCGLRTMAWQLADALWSFFYLRKHWVDWHDTHHVGLAAAQAAHDRRAEAWMLTSLGAAHEELRRFKEAIDCYQRSLAISREVGARCGEGRTLNKLGIVYRRLRRFKEAIECCQRSLAIRREVGDRYGEGGTLNNLGDLYRDLRQVAKAIDCYQRALMIHREVEDRRGEGVALANLGETYRCLGRFDEAIDHCHQALMIHREVGARHGEARTLDYLGLAVQHTEGAEAARVSWREAFAIFTELGAPEADEVRARLEQGDRVPR